MMQVSAVVRHCETNEAATFYHLAMKTRLPGHGRLKSTKPGRMLFRNSTISDLREWKLRRWGHA